MGEIKGFPLEEKIKSSKETDRYGFLPLPPLFGHRLKFCLTCLRNIKLMEEALN